MKYKIGASLGCADQLNLGKDIKALIDSGIDFLHVDIMDGIYVNNYCFGTQLFDYLKNYKNIEIEVHLMVDDPFNKLEYFRNKFFSKISFHIEASKNPLQTLSKIKDMERQCGIALNAATNESSISYIYDFIDYILIMAVEAGFTGQDFIPTTVDKIRKIRKELKKRDMDKDIYVDGHIDSNTIPLLARAGANAFVGGSSGLFNDKSTIKNNIKVLRNSIKE